MQVDADQRREFAAEFVSRSAATQEQLFALALAETKRVPG